MISLEEHNRKRMPQHIRKSKNVPTGIACPKCESELVNPEPNMMSASSPPQMRVKCPSCGYDGFALR